MVDSSIEARSVEDVRSAVRGCADSGYGLMPVGGGVCLHVGHLPTKEVVRLSTTNLDTIVEYVPEDLVVIADAGVTLATLQAELAKNGQWLPVDVALPGKQTLGGLVSTRANSTLRSGFGGLRDWLIGVELVNADAQIVVGGGKVVKNVSGYDLPKLYCGAWGTLGVVTKTNFKVSPLPEADRALLVILSNDRNAEDCLDALLAKHTPASAFLFNPSAATAILGEDAAPAQYLYVRFIGLREDVDTQMDSAAAAVAPYAASVIALPVEVSLPLARQLADFSAVESRLAVTYHILSSQVGAHIRMVEWIASRNGLSAQVVSDAACGIVTAHFNGAETDKEWLAFLPLFKDKAERVGGSLIVERMPDSWRKANFPVWSPLLPDFRIMQLIKNKLDPGNVFNPGRFMGGL